MWGMFQSKIYQMNWKKVKSKYYTFFKKRLELSLKPDETVKILKTSTNKKCNPIFKIFLLF